MGGQGNGGLVLLGVRQTFLAFQHGLDEIRRGRRPNGVHLHGHSELAAPGLFHFLEGLLVPSVAVEHQQGMDPVGLQGVEHVEDIVLKGLAAQGDAPFPRHPVGRVAAKTGRSHNDPRVEFQGNLLGVEGGVSRIFHQGDVLVVLLDGTRRQDGRLEQTAIQQFPDLLASVLPQQDPVGIDVAPQPFHGHISGSRSGWRRQRTGQALGRQSRRERTRSQSAGE